jgi:serine/threonine protein phosphatase PrpC
MVPMSRISSLCDICMDSQTALTIEVAALSDMGCKRTNNEDSFGYDLSCHIFVVCDGMGGMVGGEVASHTAVSQLVRLYRELSSSEVSVEKRLYQAIVHANREVRALARDREHLRGMGTTLVTACIDGRKIVIGNLGDSRAYFFRDGSCVQITQDHSYLAEQVRCGAISAADAERSPLQSFITKAIGVSESVEPDFFTAALEPGDIVLLTTDGLTRYADENKIAAHVFGSPNLDEACQQLIGIAKTQGAADNVTCLLLRFTEDTLQAKNNSFRFPIS